MTSSLRPPTLASALVIALLATACNGGATPVGDVDAAPLAIAEAPDPTVAAPATTESATPLPRPTTTIGSPPSPDTTASPSPTPSTEAATRAEASASPSPSASTAAPAPAKATSSPTPSAAPKPTPTPTPTAAPAPKPSPTPTPTPTAAPQPSPSPSPTGSNAAPARTNVPVFATAVDVDLYLPSDRVEVIGYHESNHDGARNMTPHGSLGVTMETRGRDNPPRGSADVALPKDAAVYAPVTGTVKRSGTYTLYCKYSDDFLVIEPDAHPGWEVKLLHIDGVQVRAGDRVEAGVTLVAPRPTQLPFESQVNDHTAARDTPHVHIEVVDPSIKDRPSEGGSGC